MNEQEQINQILKIMKTEKSIQNKTVQIALGIDTGQARKLLQKMVADGLVTHTGSRRSSTYHMPDK